MIGGILAAHQASEELPDHVMVRGYDGKGHTGMDQVWADRPEPESASSVVVVEAKGATGKLNAKPVYQELMGPAGDQLGGHRQTQMSPEWMFVVANNHAKQAFTKAVFNGTSPGHLDRGQTFSLLICDHLWHGKGASGCACVCDTALGRSTAAGMSLPKIRGLVIENGTTTKRQQMRPEAKISAFGTCDKRGACVKQRPVHGDAVDLDKSRSPFSTQVDDEDERKQRVAAFNARISGEKKEKAELTFAEAASKLPVRYRTFKATADAYLDPTPAVAGPRPDVWTTPAKKNGLQKGDRIKNQEGKFETITNFGEGTPEHFDVLTDKEKTYRVSLKPKNEVHTVSLAPEPAEPTHQDASLEAAGFHQGVHPPARPPSEPPPEEPAGGSSLPPSGVDVEVDSTRRRRSPSGSDSRRRSRSRERGPKLVRSPSWSPSRGT